MKEHKVRIVGRPMPSSRRDKLMMVKVINPKTNRIKTIHFGMPGYRHNYSKMAHKKYMARSAGIKDKNGRLTKDDPMKSNYWARRVLWPGRKEWKK